MVQQCAFHNGGIMAKFAVRHARAGAQSPISTGPTADRVNHEGTPAFSRDPKSELFLLAVANMVAEDTFYERAADRDDRFVRLIHAVVAEDPGWVARFVPYLRGELLLRSASVVLAAEYALALRAAGDQVRAAAPAVRQVIAGALQRPDEPAEFIGYWRARTGSVTLPGGVQRGVADAVTRLFTERAALKYDGVGRAIRMGDVVELAHPRASAPGQDALFAYLLDRRHHPDQIRADLGRLPMISANRALDEVPAADRRAFLATGADAFAAAGFTWEELSGWLGGPMDADAWESIIPSMGYMALLRNLRNFDQAGVSDAVAATVAAKLADPEQVARSRQFPFRFLSAYQAAPSLRWGWALEQALNASLANVPSLPGRTLILVDRSASMFWDTMSRRSDLSRADGAALFGTALAQRSEQADLVQFGSSSERVPLQRGESVLPVVQQRFKNLGGTNTWAAADAWFKGHDRVVIVTDEQSHDTPGRSKVPAGTPVYTWNLAGYQAGHAPSGGESRHTFGGLTDQGFRMIPLLESRRSTDWPF